MSAKKREYEDGVDGDCCYQYQVDRCHGKEVTHNTCVGSIESLEHGSAVFALKAHFEVFLSDVPNQSSYSAI